MKACAIIFLFQVSYISYINGMAISRPETHSVSKRSADHGITDATSRHRNALQRQLLLAKLLNAVDASSVSPVFDGADSNSEPTRKHRPSKAGRQHKRRSGKARRALEKSLGKILRSEYGDDVLDAIADVIPKDDVKARRAVQRIRPQ